MGGVGGADADAPMTANDDRRTPTNADEKTGI
jgi:hypothetical protein